MKTQPYIKLYNFVEFTLTENALMSLIVSLHENKQRICFANDYAAKKCCCSDRTIRTILSKFVKEGYVELTYSSNGRIIKLLKTPLYIDLPPSCEISDGVENTSTPMEMISTPMEMISTPMETTSTQTETISTNIRVDIKEDIKESRVEGVYGGNHFHPSDFLSFVEEYKDEDAHLGWGFQRWEKMTDKEKLDAKNSLPFYEIYLKENQAEKKSLHYFLEDKVWEWKTIKQISRRPKPKPVLTNQDKIRIFEEEMKRKGIKI
jgi:hypothetical protein